MLRAWKAFAAIALAASSAALGAGCGAAAPKLDGNVYRDGAIAFRTGDVPPSWSSIHVDRATLAWRDEPNRASVLVDARCHRKDDDVPLLALTDHLVMGTTERDIRAQDTLPFDGREAMHSKLRAKLDGVPMDYDVFVTKKDGCVYDFVYVGEPDASEPGQPAFERFVMGFHAIGGAT